MKNVCLIGYGKWGKILFSKLDQISTVNIVENKNVSYIDKTNNCSWVFVATPNHTHCDIVKNCLLNGKNVFCEKPLTLSFEKSEKLFEISSKMGVKLYVSDIENFGKNDIKLKDKNFFYRTKTACPRTPCDPAWREGTMISSFSVSV